MIKSKSMKIKLYAKIIVYQSHMTFNRTGDEHYSVRGCGQRNSYEGDMKRSDVELSDT